jgi:cellulose synthase/poly-beta-1,6-N-acetylglucosamine synthase-like glycosyltransferase
MENNFSAVLMAVIGFGLAAATLPGTAELILLTLGGLLPVRKAKAQPDGGTQLRLAIVVPAHNEAAGIRRCVRSLLRCEPASDKFAVVVVADNCTDDTADVARDAGAITLVRCDPQRRGKGYALDFAFQTLLAEGYDALIVVDADTVVDANFTLEFRRLFSAGAEAIQCRYTVNNANTSTRTRLMNIALFAFNVLRPRGRDRWGLSAGLLGNGFGLSSETLRAVPYDAVSVVEDLEYHLRLVRSGRAVRFADAVTVRADMPAGGPGAKTQRARWEGGRFRMLLNAAPALLKEVLHGRFRLLEPLLELLLLPLAFHVALLLAALAAPFGPSRIYASVGLGLVALHIVAAIRVGGGGWKDFAALAAAPFYVVWKALLIPAMLRTARTNAEWVRTERAGTGGEK